MAFLATTDLKGSISTTMLNQLTAAGADFAQCLVSAISELAPLRDNFNIDGELAKIGTQRNDELLRILIAITVYYLYNTVEDDSIPERVNDNYKKALKDIAAIASGKQGTTIERLYNEDGEALANMRVSDDEPRDLNFYW